MARLAGPGAPVVATLGRRLFLSAARAPMALVLGEGGGCTGSRSSGPPATAGAATSTLPAAPGSGAWRSSHLARQVGPRRHTQAGSAWEAEQGWASGSASPWKAIRRETFHPVSRPDWGLGEHAVITLEARPR